MAQLAFEARDFGVALRSGCPRKAAAPKVMTPGGESGSWQGSLANQERIGTQFLVQAASDVWGVEWGKVPEEQICTEACWGSLATFLVDD